MEMLSSSIVAGFLVQLKPLCTKFPYYLGDNLVIQMQLFSVWSVCIGFISQLVEMLKKFTRKIMNNCSNFYDSGAFWFCGMQKGHLEKENRSCLDALC